MLPCRVRTGAENALVTRPAMVLDGGPPRAVLPVGSWAGTLVMHIDARMGRARRDSNPYR